MIKRTHDLMVTLWASVVVLNVGGVSTMGFGGYIAYRVITATVPEAQSMGFAAGAAAGLIAAGGSFLYWSWRVFTDVAPGQSLVNARQVDPGGKAPQQ